jgi:aromatic ring-opening dioxygenase catalytic subunit (LigB family)
MQPILFLSHGGGPLPILGDPSHAELVNVYSDIRGRLQKPKTIIVITAHWEESAFSVSNAAAPDMLYDYGGFPPEAYSVTYSAPGAPEIANEIASALKLAGVPSKTNAERGYDHGVFVPLKLLYPEADIPVVMVSLNQNFDPAEHIEFGKVLARFREDNCLIIGSGMQFHNLPLMFNSSSPMAQKSSAEFTHWLDETLTDPRLTQVQRVQALTDWAQAPSARLAHPREEHLLPLHVCFGAANNAVAQLYSFTLFDLPGRCYWWAEE